MDTHDALRIEIIIEKPALRRLGEALERSGVKGYTVLPVLAGYGRTGRWSEEGQVGAASDMVMVLCLVAPERADAVLEAVFRVVNRQIGVVAVSSAAVVRRDRF